MKNYADETYLKMCEDIMEKGIDRSNRTGIDTRSIFGYQARYDLSKGFPILTTKKTLFKSVISELLWFIEGSGDERRLAEIRYGKDRSELADKKTIWTANGNADYWKPKAKFEGDLGRVYGVQWRNWENKVDQLAEVVRKVKETPDDRRIIMSAWNPSDFDNMALPPCHVLYHFYVAHGKVSCLLYQRSADTFLGVPFNIVSASALTHMVAHVTGLEVGELIHSLGDAHIYHNHFDQIKKQMSREPFSPPKLWLNPDVKNIDDFTMDDIKLEGYESHEAIKGKMAV